VDKTVSEHQLFIEWAFKGLLAGGLAYGLTLINRLTTSIESLNIKIAVLIERTENHAKTIEKHDERISNIEKRV
jgi:hypothetical protein